jgi:TRAP-type C4-dicarboxylate transport system permease small subunit
MAENRREQGEKQELTDLGQQIEEATKAADLQDPDAGKSLPDRVINKTVEIAGVAVLMTIVALVFVNATGRYTIGKTFIWGDEVVLSLLPWLGMLGMFLSIRRRQIIRIDFFVGLFPDRLRQFLSILGSLTAAGVFIWLAIVSLEYLHFFGGDRTIYLRLRKGWFQSALVIGPALAALAYALMIVEDLRAARRAEGPPT